jgi:hypothetical protein
MLGPIRTFAVLEKSADECRRCPRLFVGPGRNLPWPTRGASEHPKWRAQAQLLKTGAVCGHLVTTLMERFPTTYGLQ